MAKSAKATIEQRKKELVFFLTRNHQASLADLADALHVSPATARRDVNSLLEDRTLLKCRNGQFALNEEIALDANIFTRSSAHYQQKVAIARCATQFIRDGEIIGANASSSVLELIKLLPQFRDLTVVTNSLLAAPYLTSCLSMRLFSIGGSVYLPGLATVGELACEEIKKYTFDIAFSSASALDTDFGLSISEPHSVITETAFLDRGVKRILLLDSSKIGRRAFRWFYSLDRIDMVITDSLIDPAEAEKLRTHGIPLTIAEL